MKSPLLPILTPEQAAPRLARRAVAMTEAEEAVAPILDRVRRQGDGAVLAFARQWDGFQGESLRVPTHQMVSALDRLSGELRDAMATAIQNIRKFAEAQKPAEFQMELGPGHAVGQIIRPLQTVAAYIPGGRYPLPSTLMMACVPAQVAGVPNVWVTTPKPHDAVLGAAALVGVQGATLIGGAHAIAAYAFGTDTIPKADRIVGPGNRFVTVAKKLLAGEVGIDFIAGPTEVVILATDGNPNWIAADMLAQAEHDTDASAILLTTNMALAQTVAAAVEQQLETLPTADVARISIANNSAIIVSDSTNQLVEIANDIAAEHLCVHEEAWLPNIRNAGSVFLGPTSPEAAGDYITGPNHVLPTAGAARLRGGLSVTDFLKVITVQKLSPEALNAIGREAAILARCEGLEAHARSIEVRLED